MSVSATALVSAVAGPSRPMVASYRTNKSAFAKQQEKKMEKRYVRWVLCVQCIIPVIW